MKKIVVFVFVLTCILFSGCKSSESTDKIKVGVLMPLTGDLAFLGQSFANAMIMNADTSKVELFIQDSKGEPKTAINVVNQLISTKNVDVVVSLMPSISETINPILQAKGITHFVFAFSPDITNADNVIKQYPSSDAEDIELLAYAKTKGAKSVAFLRHIISDAEDAYKSIVIPRSKKMGIIVYDEPFEENTKDFNSLAHKIKNYNSDLIVVQSFSYNYLNIVRSFYLNGISDKMVGDLNFNDLYTYDFETVKEMDNIPFLGMSYVLTDKYKVFESSFSEKFKDRPSVMSAFPYDVMTIINALGESGMKKKEIIKYYNEHEVHGVTGILRYDQKGNQNIEYLVMKYENGEFKKLEK